MKLLHFDKTFYRKPSAQIKRITATDIHAKNDFACEAGLDAREDNVLGIRLVPARACELRIPDKIQSIAGVV